MFDLNQMDDLQDKYGTKPEETETEYLWTVSLTGGDRILLNGNETSGYWGPGVFLNTGLNLPNDPNSLTSRVAYRADGINVLESGQSILIPFKSLSDKKSLLTYN